MTARHRTNAPFVFVLMPFSEEFRDIYQRGIKLACAEAGARCERVDEQKWRNKTILQRICDQIQKADMIVADMSGRNPNVFYEVGYAHALNKHVILLAKSATEIPFDLNQHKHLVYGGSITDLAVKLKEEIDWSIAALPERTDSASRAVMRRMTRILAQVSKTVAGQIELQPLLKSIVADLTEILEAEVCSIFLRDDRHPQVIRCVAGSGFAEPLIGKAEYRSGEGFTGKVFQRGQTAVIGSRRELKRLRERKEFKGKYDDIQWAAYRGRSQFRNGIATPLRVGDETIGVLKVENKITGDFSIDDVSILEAIANGVLGVSFQNARLLHGKKTQASRQHRVDRKSRRLIVDA